MKHVLFAVTLALVGVGACATKRLPAGTPPPEYETHAFQPWPPASAAPRAAVSASGASPSAQAQKAAPAASAAPPNGKTPPSPSPSAAAE